MTCYPGPWALGMTPSRDWRATCPAGATPLPPAALQGGRCSQGSGLSLRTRAGVSPGRGGRLAPVPSQGVAGLREHPVPVLSPPAAFPSHSSRKPSPRPGPQPLAPSCPPSPQDFPLKLWSALLNTHTNPTKPTAQGSLEIGLQSGWRGAPFIFPPSATPASLSPSPPGPPSPRILKLQVLEDTLCKPTLLSHRETEAQGGLETRSPSRGLWWPSLLLAAPKQNPVL